MPEKITLDRSTLDRFATCPNQGYLCILLEAMRAIAQGMEVFPWEQRMLDEAHPELIASLGRAGPLSDDNELCGVGSAIHDLIKAAFEKCEGDLEIIPDYFVENLPAIRPDFQPQAIRAARHVADVLANIHIKIVGVEKQLEYVLTTDDIPELKDEVVLTMAYDLFGFGLNFSIHVNDWKTGYKVRTSSETKDSFQAQFGSWLLWKQPEYAEITTVHWWYQETRFGSRAYAKFVRDEERPRLPHLSTEVAIGARIMEAVRMFLQGCTDCWPEEKKCAWCPVIKWCELAHMDAIEIAVNPRKFVDSYIVKTALLRKQKRLMTAYIKGSGPIKGSKQTFGKAKPSAKFTTEFTDNEQAKGLATTGDADLDSHFN